MRPSLASWLADADAFRYSQRFRLAEPPEGVRHLSGREGDLYLSLVAELFERLGDPPEAEERTWAALGNGFAEFGFFRQALEEEATPADTSLFSAAAFYMGGYSASAYLMLAAGDLREVPDGHRAAYELLARPAEFESARVRDLVRALASGDTDAISAELALTHERATAALAEGPEEWVGWRLYEEVLRRFVRTNVRKVLPERAEGFWDPLVASFLRQKPPVWDFFPSQISAIERGVVESDQTFSLQMPTGSGKTALTETIIFSHLTQHPEDVAVLVVPYRSLASELRQTLVARLNRMGIRARSLYGGTVPTGDEVHALDDLRALVATPESLSGLLSAQPEFLGRISLVVCDEGHLLDAPTRGVALELLLARLRGHRNPSPRFVFISAIVPNIDEVNAWLGGTDDTVMRSEFRPALAEFARLDSTGSGGGQKVALRFHPHTDSTFAIEDFLTQDDFRYLAADTGRYRTYSFGSFKARAVASARKALAMGSVAVFAANKRGAQGCVGLAEELLSQLQVPTTLPAPIEFVRDRARLQPVVEYLTLEYGGDWIGTRALDAGAVVHHGDIPQETREVLELLLRSKVVGLAFCTSTLAEGVNLPIRTIVLYSVQRRFRDGRAENLLARDITNLVGRAGRAGSTTKGLVICANPGQWNVIEPAAKRAPGEPVHGALIKLLRRLFRAVTERGGTVTNEFLERAPGLYTLIDGIDATLMDLATEALPEEELVRLAGDLTTQTYAAQEATPEINELMRTLFQMRARRIAGIRDAGRLTWIRETGARARMLDMVETGLLPLRERWDDIVDPIDPSLLRTLIDWAWDIPGVTKSVREAARDDEFEKETFRRFVELWLAGRALVDIAASLDLSIDNALAIQSTAVAYEFFTLVEQGISLLQHLVEARGRAISAAALQFPQHLRFGTPNGASRVVAGVVRHRRAAVAIGASKELAHVNPEDDALVLEIAAHIIADSDRWIDQLGRLILDHTQDDLQSY